MIKLAYGGKKKIVKLEKGGFIGLRGLIKQSFPDVPADYMLSYLDQDKDEITLGSEEDVHIMLSAGLKINNVYIKQSLSQAIEITEQIEPSFQLDTSNIKKVQPQETHSEAKVQFRKGDKILDDFFAEKIMVEEKSVEIEAPIYHSAEIIDEKPIDKKQEPIETGGQSNNKPQLQIDLEPNQGHLNQIQKKQELEEEEPAKSQNSKSFIISAAESHKVEFDESVLNEKIQVLVKKFIQQKQIIPKKEEITDQNKHFLEIQAPKPKPKIFERKDSPKKVHVESELVYHEVVCSNCKDEYGIIGIRYQCILCDGFNICEQCESSIFHKHALLKVKQPRQAFKKDEIIEKYRNEIFSNAIPPGHYVPSISKEEANRYIDTSRQMLNESMERTQRMINDMFLKMEMTHKNPYEQHRLIEKPLQTLKQKMNHLIGLFGIDDREAKYLCEIHKNYTKEELADIYIQKKTNKRN